MERVILNITLVELVLVSISHHIIPYITRNLIADFVIRDNYQCGIFINSSMRSEESL